MAAVPVSYPKEILSICDTAAQHIDLKKTGPYILPTFTDATAFLNRGILGASILTFEENNKNIFMPNYHQMTDTSSQLSFDVGWQATLYGWEVLMGLAQLFPITSNSDKLFEATPNTDAF
ncbi:MAG: hypothetical protein GY760_03530 [Deltaproteobacteria bacterium]|nr:hypothetical protein [Deltaproteobacteria bacterium]